jgi:TonB family protein
MFSPFADPAFDLLGLAEPPKNKLRFPAGSGPMLDVAWGSFHQGFGSSLATLFGGPISPREFLAEGHFRDCWIERRIPRRAIVAAALWHIALLVLPYPSFPARPRPVVDDAQWQLTWSGPINDLPLLRLPGPKAKPSPRGKPSKPLTPRGADTFHPRQTIVSDPIRPTHPRQTLINPAAPPEPPKLLPSLPNIVQLAAVPQPLRPRLEISREVLAKLRPRMERRRQASDVSAPDLPDLDARMHDISMPISPNTPAKPKLQLNAASAPRLGARTQRSDASAAPELSPSASASGSATSTLIALSATPAPAAPIVQVPQGNLSARISISPEGPRSGVSGGAPNDPPGATGGSGGSPGSAGGTNGSGASGGGNGPAVSISGGNPSASSGISGLGTGRLLVGLPRGLPGRPDPRVAASSDTIRTSPREFTAKHPDARPEEFFGPRRVYTLHVNMPNLNSVTGSWVLSFVELREDPSAPISTGDVSGPIPLRKVDPKYPPAVVSAKVEGEVVLYAVIRKDGSVDSIQLVHGLDEQLDANAMHAFSDWKFRPAGRGGVPVELEAIVHIPFRAVARPY